MFAAIGNSPSSGSTLLADLLDSTPETVCGNELNLLTNKNIYRDFASFQHNPFSASTSPDIYYYINQLNRHRLFSYALDQQTYVELVNNAADPQQFLKSFGNRYSAFRGKPGAVWFEKTPQNIVCARQYLELSHRGRFIHIVRNPVHVIASLRRRNFPTGIALFTWLFAVSNIYSLTNDRLITVRYEDLVREPWAVVSALLHNFDIDISPDELKHNYENNTYRKALSRKQVKGWKICEYGTVKNANTAEIDPAVLRLVKQAMNGWKISSSWAQAYDIPPLGFNQAVEYFGYTKQVNDMLEGIVCNDSRLWTLRDRVVILRKHYNEFKKCGIIPPLVQKPVLCDPRVALS